MPIVFFGNCPLFNLAQSYTAFAAPHTGDEATAIDPRGALGAIDPSRRPRARPQRRQGHPRRTLPR